MSKPSQGLRHFLPIKPTKPTKPILPTMPTKPIIL